MIGLPPPRRIVARRVAAVAVALLVAGPVSCDIPPHDTTPEASPSALASGRPSPASSTETSQPMPTSGSSFAATPVGTVTGLWCLCGTSAGIELRTADGSATVTLPSSISGPAWAAGDAATGFIVTAGGGGLYDSGSHPDGAPGWDRLPITGVPAGELDREWAFGSVSPDRTRVAAIAGSPGSGVRDTRLIVVGRRDGQAIVTNLAAEEDGRPAVWFDDRTVGVPIRDALDRPALEIVDLGTGSRRVVTTDAGAIATASATGSVAFQARSDGRILVGPASGLGTNAGFSTIPTGAVMRTAGQLILDDRGQRLAVVWTDDSGDEESIGVYERAGGAWKFVTEVMLPPGTTRAVLAGFDP